MVTDTTECPRLSIALGQYLRLVTTAGLPAADSAPAGAAAAPAESVGTSDGRSHHSGDNKRLMVPVETKGSVPYWTSSPNFMRNNKLNFMKNNKLNFMKNNKLNFMKNSKLNIAVRKTYASQKFMLC